MASAHKERLRHPSLFPGEIIVTFVPHVLLFASASRSGSSGTVFVTNYRMSFIPDSRGRVTGDADSDGDADELEIPLAPISKMIAATTKNQKIVITKISGSLPQLSSLLIHSKDCRQWRFGLQFVAASDVKKLIDSLAHYVFPTSKQRLFAFDHRLSHRAPDGVVNGFHDATLTRLTTELSRCKADMSAWRLTMVNEQYRFCQTYPSVFVVPSEVSDEDIERGGNAYLGNRTLVWCWQHSNGAVLLRAGQLWEEPQTRLEQLQQLRPSMIPSAMAALPAAITALPSVLSSIIPIAAISSPSAAKQAPGPRPNPCLEWCRQSLNLVEVKTSERCASLNDLRTAYDKLVLLCVEEYPEDVSDFSWIWNAFTASGEASHWLTAIHQSLLCAEDSCRALAEGRNVAIFGDEGRNHDCVIASLVQVMMDPYFRTRQGFDVLLQKEWLAFGHPFPQRLGLVVQPGQAVLPGPVFLLFLNCVCHLMDAFPFAFQYTQGYLLEIHRLSLSCLFGTFMHDSDFDRVCAPANLTMVSMFTHFAGMTSEEFLAKGYGNVYYSPRQEPLIGTATCPSIKVWGRCFSHHDDIHVARIERQMVRKEAEAITEVQQLLEKVAELAKQVHDNEHDDLQESDRKAHDDSTDRSDRHSLVSSASSVDLVLAQVSQRLRDMSLVNKLA